MKMRKYAALLLPLLLMLCSVNPFVAAAEPALTVTNSAAYATDCPANSNLIVALYQNERLVGTKIYNGTGTIQGNYTQDLEEALTHSDSIKTFLWDISTLTPLIPCFSSRIADLPEEPTEKPERVLTLFFSCTGNTHTLAEKIHTAAGGDMAEIIPAEPYTSADLNYNDNSCRANQELNSDARPAIEPLEVDVSQYDVILLGYPIWWGQCPPVVRTFLDSYDLSSKTILPFCTSGSTGISGSLSKIRELAPDSTVTDGFRGTSSTGTAQIDEWLRDNHFTEAVFMRMKLAAANGDIIVKLEQNNAAKNLAAMLPLDLNFSDYNNTEKIAYPPEEIDISNTTPGTAPKTGDLTIYAPWGNLALFYKDWSYSSSLIPLGRIESGAERIPALDGTIRAEAY